ncbi:hypothetical protein HZA33_02650 [Candidatus Pacearchaeota archaeon]|nr:hypothetical protein [Candidatus Pacearchaeota archaeon]
MLIAEKILLSKILDGGGESNKVNKTRMKGEIGAVPFTFPLESAEKIKETEKQGEEKTCGECENCLEGLVGERVEICGEKLEKYRKALLHLGIEYKKDSLIKIDATGYSEEVANEVGQDYLGKSVILVSEKQRGASYNQRYSFIPILMQKFYESYAQRIEQFLEKEPLIGTPQIVVVQKGKKKLLDLNENGKTTITLEFDTPARSVKKIRNAIKRVESIDKNPLLILRQGYMGRLLQQVAKLNEQYDSIKGFGTDLLTATAEFSAFRVASKYYFLNDNSFVELNINESSDNGFVPKEHIRESKTSSKDILESLIALKLAEYDRTKVRNRMRAIQEETLKINVSLDAFSYYHLINRDEFRSKLPEEWYNLRAVLDGKFILVPGVKEETDFVFISSDKLTNYLKNAGECKLVDEILEKLKNLNSNHYPLGIDKPGQMEAGASTLTT